jgi:hypothetical protein
VLGFAQKAAQDAKDTEKLAYNGKQIELGTVPDKLHFECHPLPTARPEYKPDSQTIVVDTNWVRAVEPIVVSINQETVIL